MLALLPVDVADGLRKEQLKKSGLGKVVMFLYKLPDESLENRRAAKVPPGCFCRVSLGHIVCDRPFQYGALLDVCGERCHTVQMGRTAIHFPLFALTFTFKCTALRHAGRLLFE